MRQNLLDVTQAAAYLQLSPHQVRRLVAKQAIPFVMVGPFVRFEQATLETWRTRLATIELRDRDQSIDLTAMPTMDSRARGDVARDGGGRVRGTDRDRIS